MKFHNELISSMCLIFFVLVTDFSGVFNLIIGRHLYVLHSHLPAKESHLA